MRLLLTNDDGLDSVFLHALARALAAAGHELAIVAPACEQSWIGAAKSRHRPVASAVADPGLGGPTWRVDGTPSDCVNIALAHLLPRAFRPEAVVSGINIGRNASLGFIPASGTIGGAWEGALHGLPAVALSQDLTAEAYAAIKSPASEPAAPVLASLREAAVHAARLAPGLVAATAPQSFVVHSLNFPFPCRADAAVKRTVPARIITPGLFSPAADDGTHRFVFKSGTDVSPPGLFTDRAALDAGDISHTVLDYTRLGAM
ncbi:MAG: 5'/3'-nucleotidase SurE [Verrucomicrobiota bacterium]